jgi:hypothetical protein
MEVASRLWQFDFTVRPGFLSAPFHGALRNAG